MSGSGAHLLTERFDRAFLLASKLHASQLRKGSDVPYLSHLLAVASLVLEADGDEDQAIAALLHDAAEDQGGLATLAAIEAEFGARVGRMAADLSDTFETPKPPWRARKEAYLAHLAEAGPDTRLVSLADKVHNARCILRDVGLHGDGFWEIFNQDKAGVLWYYRSLADIFNTHQPGWLADELERVVAELEHS